MNKKYKSAYQPGKLKQIIFVPLNAVIKTKSKSAYQLGSSSSKQK